MNNKTNIEEIKENFNRIETIIKQEVCLFNQTIIQGNLNQIERYIENILAYIERLEKENEEYKIKENSRIVGKYNEIEIHDLIEKTIQKDYIEKANKYDSLVEKIKDKIEELEKLIIETQKELGSASKEYTIYVYQKSILQELLEKE